MSTLWLLKASAVLRGGGMFRAGRILWQGEDSFPLGYSRQTEAQLCEGNREDREWQRTTMSQEG